MAGRRAPVAAALAVVVAVAAGCDSPAKDDPAPDGALRPQWQAVSLPVPPGEPGRLMLRDATVCGGRWYVVGAVMTATGDTRPAVWSSGDARAWSAVRLRPVSYYGERNILYAVGCGQGRIAVIGAKAGGAHGNPRVRTWRQLADGSLAEVEAEFLLYGGWAAVNVSRIAGGPKGWLMAGGRDSGAAVWRSPDAAGFRIVEGAPNLASGDGFQTSGSDVIAVPDGWVVGGSGRATGRPDRDPLVWTSPDGLNWARVALPAGGDDEAVQRLVQVGAAAEAAGGASGAASGASGPAGGPSGAGGAVRLAVGVRGTAFGAWHADSSGTWRDGGRFGEVGAGVVAGVESVAADGDGVLAATVAAAGHRLWRGDAAGTRWRAVSLPVAVPPGGFTAASVAAAGGLALLLTDDGTAPAAWVAAFPAGG